MAQESRLTITLDTRSAEQGAKDLTLALNAMEVAGIRVAAMSDRVNGSMAGVSNATLSSAASAAVMDRVLKSALSGFSAMGLIEMAEQWDSYAERMAVATQSLGEYDQAQARVAQVAQATFRPIDETREAFIALSPALREIGLGFDQSMDAVGAFSGLLATNGASAESGAVAMEAFANSFRSGAVDASDWAQITGTVDSLISHMADSTGKTTAEIDQLGKSGQMSVQMLAQGLASSYIPALQQVELMPRTVSGALTNLNSAFGEYVGNTNNSLQATTLLASGINFISQNFESFADVLGTVALGALGVYTSRTIGAVAASSSAAVASYTKANATLAAARTDAQAAAAALAIAQANLGLTTTLGQLTAAKLADEAATKRLAVAQAAMPRVGATLLGLMGGPAGLIITAGLAAASFITLGQSTEQAVTGASRLGTSLSQLKERMTGMTQNQLLAEIRDFQKDARVTQGELAKTNAQISYLADSLARFPNSPSVGEWRDELITLRSSADGFKQKIDGLNQAVAMFSRQMAIPVTWNGVEALPANVQQQIDAISRQIALYGKTGLASQLAYDLESGAMGDMGPEHSNQISDLIKQLDALERRSAQVTKIDDATRLLDSLEQQVITLGMTESELQKYQLTLAKATPKQLERAAALMVEKEAFEKNQQAQNAYKSLMLDLRTEEERTTELFREKIRVLDDAELSAQDYANAMQRVVTDSISPAPQFGGIQTDVGGGTGSLLQVATAEAALEEWRAREIEKKAVHFAEMEGKEEEHLAAILEINARYNEQQANLSDQWELATIGSFATVTGDAAQMLKSLGQEGTLAYKVLFIASKAANIAQAIMNTEVAAGRARADLGPALGEPMAAKIRMIGYASVAMIAATSLSGMAHDGLDQIPREGTWLLDKGERVLSSRQNSDLTSYLQRANTTSAGGVQSAPINVEVNISGNGSAQMQTSGGSQADARQLGELIAGQVQKVLASEMRQGGLLWNQQQGYA